jgi:hypothetical protein
VRCFFDFGIPARAASEIDDGVPWLDVGEMKLSTERSPIPALKAETGMNQKRRAKLEGAVTSSL